MKKGQTMVEILVALGIFVTAVGAAFFVFFISQQLTSDTANFDFALARANQGMEVARQMRDQDWDSLSQGDHGLIFSDNHWQFGCESDAENNFTRQINVLDVDANTKRVTTTILWKPDFVRQQRIELIEELTNWKNLASGGLSGDWTKPQILSSLDIGPGNTATDLFARNKIIYLTATASSFAKPDFFIIDATNSQNPFIKASLHTGPGLNALAIAENYAYAANNDNNQQLQVINISQLTNPSLATTLTLAGSEKGLSIFIQDNKIYFGTKKSDGPEFFVIDINNPLSPLLVGSLEINSDVNAIYVEDTVAYIATDKDTELITINISNPLSPTILGSINLPGDSEDGKSVYVVYPKAYVSRSKGANHTNHHEIHIEDISNPSLITTIGSKDTAADVNDILTISNLAFAATSNPNQEFQIFEISNPQSISLYGFLNLPQLATAISFENNIIYLALRSNDALRIITSL